MTSPHPIIAITLGDPGGIGPEVTVKALTRLLGDPLFKKASVILIGPRNLYQTWIQRTQSKIVLNGIPDSGSGALARRTLYLDDRSGLPSPFRGRRLPETEYPSSFAVGKVSRNNAVLAFSSLRRGAWWAQSGRVDGLVTAPVNKEAMRLVHPHFAGHTGYLAEASRSKQVAMMFEGGRLRVTLASIHVPLKEVSRLLKKADVIEKIRLTHEFLRKFHGLRRPRIAVCALNPHGGEFGREEGEIILPAIRTARRKGIRAMGPFPGDAIFHEALRGKYDAVVAMYHDQGLGPLKTVAFHEAVNITLGLPYVRTSPDHGTAFNIAYRNRADESSMLAAIRRALELVS